MKYLLLILTVVMFSSCLTQKRCAERFPPQIVTKTETITEIVYRDTTIYVPIPGETVYDSIPVPIPCPDLPEFDLSKYVMSKETQFAKAEAWLTFSLEAGLQMHLLLEQKEQEIEHTIENAIRENSTHTTTTVDVIHEVPYVTWWHKTASRFTIFILLSGFGLLVFRLVR